MARTNRDDVQQLILASTSIWRRRILDHAGLPHHAEPPGVDESLVELDDPAELAVELARLKALAVACRFPEAWVIGADQVASDPVLGSIWGKPKDPGAHLSGLLQMRGRRHELVTGFAIASPDGLRVGVERTTLWLRADLTDHELSAYVDTAEGSGCAGGYAAEGRGAFLFERIEGDWFNVLGLPLFRVMDVLRILGWRFGASSE